MNNWFHKIYQNRYFLLFIMLFAYVHSIYSRISVWDGINAYTFTPEAVLFSIFESGILFFITQFFINKWQKSDVFSRKEIIKIFGSTLILYPIVMQVIALVIALTFNKYEQNFNSKSLTLTTLTFFLNGFVYGSFFIAYNYYNKNKRNQEKLAKYHQSLSESKMYQLKSQLNPHFLFNNLNILDQLIEEDKQKASEFLYEFAEIYRYILQTSDMKLINLQEEIKFARQYFSLIKYKYGNAYQMNIQVDNDRGYIVPMTLQLMIENAVQHNIGTENNPILISINVKKNIRTCHNINLNKNVKFSNGKSLNNLKEQYKLLTENTIQIKKTDKFFIIIIPIINNHIL